VALAATATATATKAAADLEKALSALKASEAKNATLTDDAAKLKKESP
jgi:hypothetical protein